MITLTGYENRDIKNCSGIFIMWCILTDFSLGTTFLVVAPDILHVKSLPVDLPHCLFDMSQSISTAIWTIVCKYLGYYKTTTILYSSHDDYTHSLFCFNLFCFQYFSVTFIKIIFNTKINVFSDIYFLCESLYF